MKEGDKISIISSDKASYSLNFKELYAFKDLLFLFVKRDFISFYKQTVLGPLWFFIQPIFSTVVFTLVFGKMAGLSTDGLPKILFYLAGIVCWNYFSECLSKISDTFGANQNIFGKVYFPRLIVPLSIVISSLMKFGVQFGLFLAVYFYYFFNGFDIDPNSSLLLFPFLVVIMAIMSLGIGVIISSMTTKYRDLKFLIKHGIQLWMFLSPIIYPLSMLEGTKKQIALFNPMTSILETFKYAFLGKGELNTTSLIYTSVFSVLVFIIGVIIFNKTEKNFMDTV